MEMGDLDMDFDWSNVDILSSLAPTLMDNPAFIPQQVNNIQDSGGTVVATQNMAQNSENTFNNIPVEETSSIMGGNQLPPLPPAINDPYQLPELPPTSSFPLQDENDELNCYIPSMVGLISEGAAGSSLSQGQDMMSTQMNYYNQFSLMQNNNLPDLPLMQNNNLPDIPLMQNNSLSDIPLMQNNNLPDLMHDMGQLNNDHNISFSNQLMVPNMLANQNFNGMINPGTSSYPPFFQQNPVNVQAGAGNGTTNGHFIMNNQISPAFGLNNHAMNNPSGSWNSQSSLWMQDQGNQYNNPLLQNSNFQQQSFTMNGPTPMSPGFSTSSALNSAIMGLSGARLSGGGSSSQGFNAQQPQFPGLLGPQRALGIQQQQVPQQQVPPFSLNTTTPQRAGNGFSIPSSLSFRAQPSVPSFSMLNQNERSTVSPFGSYSTLQPIARGQPEPPRRGRPRKHFEPGEASTTPYKRKKKGNPGKKTSSRGNNASDGAGREDQNPRNPSSAAAPREFVNTMYDPAFERVGVFIDPLLRLMKATTPESSETQTQTPEEPAEPKE